MIFCAIAKRSQIALRAKAVIVVTWETPLVLQLQLLLRRSLIEALAVAMSMLRS